jgi:hypothetical protein
MPTRMSRADAKRLAAEVRLDAGFRPAQSFDPWGFADHYGVPVVPISDSGCAPEALAHFRELRAEVLSAVLVPDGTGWVILENDSHDTRRRRSNLSHELGHMVCEHQGVSLLSPDGQCRMADEGKEWEAHEIMGELLVPSAEAIRLAVRGHSDTAIAEHFQVSPQMARWRVNVSGARTIARRSSSRPRR